MGKNATTFSPGRGAGHGGAASGPGWGGPAKGLRPAFRPGGAQPAPEAKIAGREVAAEIKARIAAHGSAILQAQLARALDLQHPHGFQAAKDLLDRVAPPESKTVLAGDASAPITRIERVIISATPPG